MGVVLSNIKLNDKVQLDNYIYLEKNDVDNLHKNIQRIIEDETKSHDDKKLLLNHLLTLYAGANNDLTIIIDEAHLYGYRGRSSNISWADDWLSIHRHVFKDNKVDIVLITQVPSRLNREIAGQIEVAVQAVASSQRISKGLMEYSVYGSVSALATQDKDMRMKRMMIKGKPEIFEIYQSGFLQEGSGDFRKKLYLIASGLLIVISYVAYSFKSMAVDPISPNTATVSYQESFDENVSQSDINSTSNKQSRFEIICRSLPKSFDFHKVRDYFYVIIGDDRNKICYRKYLNIGAKNV